MLRALDVTVASLDDAPVASRRRRPPDAVARPATAPTPSLVRPDFYVFGSVASREELPTLVGDLRAQLALQTKPLVKEH